MKNSSLKFLSPFRYQRKIVEIFDKDYKFDESRVTAWEKVPIDLQMLLGITEPALVIDLLSEASDLYDYYLARKLKILPDFVDGGRRFCQLLFAITKISRPSIVVETGVANGLSTSMMLQAMSGTRGQLHSFDVNPDTKYACADNPNWYWHQLDYRNPKTSFESQLLEIPSAVSLWVHDSDHSKFWQDFEYSKAKQLLRKDGILISDDIDDSSSWERNFSRNSRIEVKDGHKIVGITNFAPSYSG